MNDNDKEYDRPERRTPFPRDCDCLVTTTTAPPPTKANPPELPSRTLTDMDDSRDPFTRSLTLPTSSKALCSRKTKYEKKRPCNPQHCELYATRGPPAGSLQRRRRHHHQTPQRKRPRKHSAYPQSQARALGLLGARLSGLLGFPCPVLSSFSPIPSPPIPFLERAKLTPFLSFLPFWGLF